MSNSLFLIESYVLYPLKLVMKFVHKNVQQILKNSMGNLIKKLGLKNSAKVFGWKFEIKFMIYFCSLDT